MQNDLQNLTKQKYNFEIELADLRKRFKDKESEIEAKIAEWNERLRLVSNQINVDRVKNAEKYLYIRGKYTDSGDQKSVVDDMIKWLSTGESKEYRSESLLDDREAVEDCLYYLYNIEKIHNV